ncbi:MAG TPA: TIGR02996 domain-containing protein, partial [Gemmataceae bacterium]|nr:TIGR02996 domain-containing protein [Gemmataceae bacterium]
MSDDEAFIRAIVDSPGDDTPRLAYADWLDDRSDPRGPYLRAEIEWAKPWKDGVPPGWSKHDPEADSAPEGWSLWDWPGLGPVQALATDLDRLWVARVSRPPLGVCCDHLRFTQSGIRLTPDDLREAEQRLGLRFPAPFAAFLLNHTGGAPSHGQVIYASGEDDDWMWDWITVECLCWLPARGESPERNSGSLDEEYENLRSFDSDWGLPKRAVAAARFFPVATDGVGGWLLLPATSAHPDGVYQLNCDAEDNRPRLLIP